MASRLGISRGAVLGKAHRLGLCSKKEPVSARKALPKKPPRLKDLPPALPIMDEPPLAEPLFAGIPFEELTPQTCRYPQGDGPFMFCGQPKQEGSAYCAHHHRVCYLPLSRRPQFIPAPWADYRARKAR
jgi:hypothetical protein